MTPYLGAHLNILTLSSVPLVYYRRTTVEQHQLFPIIPRYYYEDYYIYIYLYINAVNKPLDLSERTIKLYESYLPFVNPVNCQIFCNSCMVMLFLQLRLPLIHYLCW